MSATNPASSTEAARFQEPSMEEILASIRRIIADDQTMPNRDAAATSPASVVPSTPSVEPHDPAPPPNVVALEQRSVPSVPFPPEPPALAPEPPIPHGPVTAPQFPSQGGYAEPELFADAPSAHAEQAIWDEPPAPSNFHPMSPGHIEPAADERHDEAFEAIAAAEDNAPPLAIGSVAMEAAADHPAEVAAHHDHANYADETIDESYEAEPEAASETGAATLFSPATDSAVSSAFNMLAASRLADNSDDLMNLAREMIRPLLRTWIDDNLPSMVEKLVRAEIERVARGGR